MVAFHGIWHGPVLPVASTDGSFTEAFTPAGGVRKATSAAHAGTASGTLRYGSATAFGQACHALAAAPTRRGGRRKRRRQRGSR